MAVFVGLGETDDDMFGEAFRARPAVGKRSIAAIGSDSVELFELVLSDRELSKKYALRDSSAVAVPAQEVVCLSV